MESYDLEIGVYASGILLGFVYAATSLEACSIRLQDNHNSTINPRVEDLYTRMLDATSSIHIAQGPESTLHFS